MKIRKSEQERRQRCGWRMAAAFGTMIILAWCSPMVSLAEAAGTVLPNSVNIRKQPDQESEVIGSSTVGKEVSIKGKVDVSGVTWYQVYVDANTLGYVRADMIEKKGDGDIPTVTVTAESQQAPEDAGAEDAGTSRQETAPSGTGSGAQVEAQEQMDLQYANTTVQAKVRPDPSTSNNPVDSLTPGTQVVVSGKSEGGDGRTWYFVSFTGANGSEKTGYIRSDLLELGEMLPVEEVPEEEPEEEPEEPAAEPRSDYELKIETTSDGEEVWYIYDNVTGQKQKLVPLLESSYSQTLDDEADETSSVVKQRIVIVVLAVLLAVLAIVTVIMAFKLRDAYYEDYEEDEEDEETDDDRPAAKREPERDRERERDRDRDRDRERERGRDRDKEREKEPTRRAASSAETEKRRREPAAEEPVRPAKARKAKNFLLDDDEFEFEFLNMDDKDLK